MTRRVPVIKRIGKYTVSLEQCRGLTYIHCDIHTGWSASLKRELQADFSNLLDLSAAQEFYTLSATDDYKHHKFLGLFGFTHMEDVPCEGGLLRHLYKIKKSE